MRDERLFQLIRDCHEIVSSEPLVLNFPICQKKLVVIGDTHGDVRTVKLIFNEFLSDPSCIFLFLGDEVDREPASSLPNDNIIYLLEMKRVNPKRIYFLLGNHSLNPYSKKYPDFMPCSFWQDQPRLHRNYYESLFCMYSFLATTDNGVLLCHAAPPITSDLSEFDLTKKQWYECLWGDYGEELPTDIDSAKSLRKRLYSYHFSLAMHQWGKSLLIRGHQPTANLTMFNNRCVTIQSVKAFSRGGLCDRRVAIIDLSKQKITSIMDIDILNIEQNFKPEIV